MWLKMKSGRRRCLLFLLVCSGVSLLWGSSLVTDRKPGGLLDFKGLYYGTRCLLDHCDPYQQDQLLSYYLGHGGEPLNASIQLQVITLFVNLPTTFLVVAPLAVMPWGAAHALWTGLIIAGITLSAILMWEISPKHSPPVAACLTAAILVNCVSLVAGGNAAGIAISACVIATWCFIRERCVTVGVLLLAVSLIIKPHDSGFVWLYFLMAGDVYRKRALQTLAVTAVLGLSAFTWVSSVVPNWLPALRANLATISMPGNLNDQGPTSFGMVIDLETAIRILWNNRCAYGVLSGLICGVLLAIWIFATLRSRMTPEHTWLALASVVPITMLVTYHRPYDATLLLIAVPACSMLWADGGKTGRLGLALTSVAVVFAGDIPLALFIVLARRVKVDATWPLGKVLTVLLARPASLILLVLAVFYLWVYARRSSRDRGRGAGFEAYSGPTMRVPENAASI